LGAFSIVILDFRLGSLTIVFFASKGAIPALDLCKIAPARRIGQIARLNADLHQSLGPSEEVRLVFVYVAHRYTCLGSFARRPEVPPDNVAEPI
jgi:hypothetical protein